MAGALVGGAFLSAFLQVAFDRLASRDFLDFLKGRKDIDRSLKKLKMLLMSADVVLAYAEDNQYTIPAVKEWLDELQDAVYDADDLLDKIALRCKLQAESQTGTIEVRKSIPALVVSLDKEIPPMLKKILEDLNIIIKQMRILSLKKDTVGVKLSSPPSQTKTSCPETCDVIGRDMDKEAIFKLWEISDVASSNKICVVPIVGMGGIGKTTLAQFVYNDEKVNKNFDFKAWVCVSDNFDNLEILKAILERINGSASNLQCLDSLETKIREILKGKKFFVVLDDIWNENWVVWDNFLKVFKCEAQEVKVIVTTRSEVVASKVCTISTHYCLKELSNKDCMEIFVHSAFGNRNPNEFPHLLEIGKKIVEKCRGLPLAAKTLGGSLCSNFNQNDWIKIWKSRIWDLKDAKTNIFPALRLSYHCIPSHLKRCFVYCSIFPKDYEFKKEELILLWMAEGLLQQPKEARRIELEEIGEEYFNDLVSRSFFQQSSKSKSCFLMHDLINDLAKSICGKFCFRLEESNESNEITKETRHLSHYKAGFNASKEFEIPSEVKGLRTLLVKSHLPTRLFKDENLVKIDLNNFKCLRVLSLYGACIKELPITVDNLIHLRYLNTCNTMIKDLPDSLCNLYNLQTLILSYDITKLPANMSKLINLRHLDNSRARMEEMPPQMGKMTNLRKLYVFGVGKHDNGSNIEELGKLQHLSGKLSILNLENVQRDNKETTTKAILKNKQNLSELKLVWKHGHGAENSKEEIILLEQLCPHTNLNSLTITNYEGTSFPKWLGDSSFSKMVFIELRNCDNCFSLPPLGQLPDLKSLKIECFGKISSVGPEFYGNTINSFKALECLSFENMPEWQEWVIFEGKVLSSLQKLYIKDCPKLSGGLPVQLPSLTILDICGCTQLVASLPKSPALDELECTGKIQILSGHDYQSLKIVFITGGGDSNLNSLSITNYEGTSFPKWLGDSSFSKMVFIELRNCDNCFSLPPLGQLPNLKTLLIQRFGKISSVGLEFYGNAINPFRALEYLSFENMPEWQEWVIFKGEVFTCLRELYIKDCPKLRESLPVQLPSLTQFTIIGGFLGMSAQWRLHKLLCRGGVYSILPFLPEFASLTRLEFSVCPDLVSFSSGGLRAPNLSEILIHDCRNLKSLPEGMHTLLPSLVRLELRWCPELESFPEGGLPSSLESLAIYGCDKLISRRMELGLQALHSLRSFTISAYFKELESFPEEALLPPNLTDFAINFFPNLKSLNGKGFQPLTSLKNLRIRSCNNLDCLLEDVLPTPLCELDISDCRLLKERYGNEKGEGRVKIAHIPRTSKVD